jgi:hypothetical protein
VTIAFFLLQEIVQPAVSQLMGRLQLSVKYIITQIALVVQNAENPLERPNISLLVAKTTALKTDW